MLPIFIIFLKIRTEKFTNSANITPLIVSNQDVKLNNSQENATVSMTKLTAQDKFCIDGECLTEYDLRLIIDGKDVEFEPEIPIGGYNDDIKQTIFIENTKDDKKINSNFLEQHDLKNFSTMWPIGIIINFKGDIEDIPEGWALCNGDNGTPDLRDRFVMGKDTSTFNQVVQKCPKLCNSDNVNNEENNIDVDVDDPVFCKNKTFSDCSTTTNTTKSTLKSKSSGPCQPGYFDVTSGKYNWWACGKNCKGGKFYTDGVCNCACQPIPKATNPNIGGENEHTIKFDEMPDHTHTLFSNNSGLGKGNSVGINAIDKKTSSSNYFSNKLNTSGGNVAYDNIPHIFHYII